jgi:tRNA U34 5-carboxymethylaminomethyl modifying enzyme MnmG/GidA
MVYITAFFYARCFIIRFPEGTTGYEEAASQGIVAGINAGLAALHRPSLILTRADGFTGVMIDDLIIKGAEEPCTSLHSYYTWTPSNDS